MFSLKLRSNSHRPRNRRRPSFESLEGRQLLSLGPEFLVNTTSHNDQFESANARSANGMAVVVWTDFSTSSDHVIRAQLFNQSNVKVGPDIVVAHIDGDNVSVTPKVAIGSQGNFVVTWTQPVAGGDTNVLAQQLKSDGTPFGGIIPVATGTFKEHDPAVAIDGLGRFVVSYTRDTNGNNPDVFAKRYDGFGNLLNVFNVGTSLRAESHSSVAASPDGTIAVAYQLQFNSTDDDIMLDRFSSSGAALGVCSIASSTAREQAPSVAIDNFDNVVVAYQKFVGGNWDIKARRVMRNGTVSYEINIRNTGVDETNPSVATTQSAPAGGYFVVAYDTAVGVKVSEASQDNFVMATNDAGGALTSSPAISVDASGNYLVTYSTTVVTKTAASPSPVATSPDFSPLERDIRGRFGRL